MTTTANPDARLQVAVGDLVAGKYRVEGVLGQGAMGVVVAARHGELGHKVAIKLLKPEVYESGEEGVARFLREAQAAAKLESDHVARVFDVGTFGEQCAFMVMEYLEGMDLERYLARHGRLEVEEAVDYVLEALEALAHAHVNGMVHRDVKPSNLFLAHRVDGTRRIKMLDFGISKTETGLGASGPGSSTLTSPHAVLGSPAYMAPEQIRSSKHVDNRADIWSVGVILYELTSGKSPFLGQNVGDTFARVLLATPEPLVSVRPDIPAQFAAIVERCLQTDETQRFANVSELSHALAPFGSARTKEFPGRIARILGLEPVPPRRAIISVHDEPRVNAAAETLAAPPNAPSKGTQITITSGLGPEPAKSSRTPLVIGIALVAAALGVFLILRPGNEEPPSAPAQEPPAAAMTTPPRSTATVSAGGPEIVPVGTAEPVLALPAPSTSAAPNAVSSVVRGPGSTLKAPATETKRTTPPTSKTKIPSGLLDGRD